MNETSSGTTGISAENSRQVILNLMRKVSQWWSQEGYKYHTGTVLTEEGHLLVTFSVSAEARRMEDQEAFVAELRSQGYTVGGEEANCAFMVDNDNNRRLIRKVIKDRFPSAKILEWVNNRQVGPDNEDFLMRKIRVEIRDITEI